MSFCLSHNPDPSCRSYCELDESHVDKGLPHKCCGGVGNNVHEWDDEETTKYMYLDS